MRGSLLLLAGLPICFAATTTTTVTVTSTRTQTASSSSTSPSSTSTKTSTVTDTNVVSTSSTGTKITTTLTTTETLASSSSSTSVPVKTLTTDVTATVSSSSSLSTSAQDELTTTLLTTTLTELSTAVLTSVETSSATSSGFIATSSTSTTSSASSSTTEASPQFTNAALFKQTMLDKTNSYRNGQSAPALVWNDTLQSYAQLFAGDCTFTASNGPYGETLSQNQPNVDSVLSNWMNERMDYNFNDPKASKGNTADFTQMVWVNTQSIGCARQNCNNANNFGGWFVVCEYYPKGNIPGKYQQNVLKAGQPVSSITTSTTSASSSSHSSTGSSLASPASKSSSPTPSHSGSQGNCENGDCSGGNGVRTSVWTFAVLLTSAMASILL